MKDSSHLTHFNISKYSFISIANRNRCRFFLDIFLQTGKLLSSVRSLTVMTLKLSIIVTEV